MFHLPKTLTYGSAVLAAVALLLAAPRAMHAVAATLVQVTNTTAEPVPAKDVDNPARHPFAATCTGQGQGEEGPASCNPLPAPPAGAETVIQSVSILVTRGNSTATTAGTYYSFVTGGQSYQSYLPYVTQQIASNAAAWVANQSTTIYEDPSSLHACSAVQSDLATQFQITCTVTGYTVSLP
jgi:hypothetical protein